MSLPPRESHLGCLYPFWHELKKNLPLEWALSGVLCCLALEKTSDLVLDRIFPDSFYGFGPGKRGSRFPIEVFLCLLAGRDPSRFWHVGMDGRLPYQVCLCSYDDLGPGMKDARHR